MSTEDNKGKKDNMLDEIRKKIEDLSKEELKSKTTAVNNKVFEFANYKESKIAMLYYPMNPLEFSIDYIFKESIKRGKVITLPYFGSKKDDIKFYKVDNLKTDLIKNDDGIMVPNKDTCKEIPIDYIDIAVIPGAAFDEKGGRISFDERRYDRLIAKLPITTRKIAFGFEEQILNQIPMESKKKYVDMIITDTRVIYKI